MFILMMHFIQNAKQSIGHIKRPHFKNISTYTKRLFLIDLSFGLIVYMSKKCSESIDNEHESPFLKK